MTPCCVQPARSVTRASERMAVLSIFFSSLGAGFDAATTEDGFERVCSGGQRRSRDSSEIMQVEANRARRLKFGRSAVSLAFLCLLAGCPATSGGPAVAPAASFLVAAGEAFDVRLPANRSTGYSWALGAALDESILTLVHHQYDAPEAGRPGEGGISSWRFRGVAAGRTTLLFFYRRPWDADAGPARTMQYSVVVQ